MTMLTLDVQELEESLDEELLCEVDHEAVAEDLEGYYPPPCSVIAAARLVACDDVILLCRAIAKDAEHVLAGPGAQDCPSCGGDCSRIVWF